MASELTTKIRLVRCPKCRKLLPELPDFNVYKCGGCGITLQAKSRVNTGRSIGSDSNTAEAVQENQTNHVHEEKEEPCSRNKGVVPCSEECSSCQNDESDQSKSGDCDGEQLRGVNLKNEDQNNENDRSDASDSDNEGSEVSNGVFSPMEFFDDKSEEFVPSGNAEQANTGDQSHELPPRNENEAAVNEEEVEESADQENEGCDDHDNNDFFSSELEEIIHDENEGFPHNENEESSREFFPRKFGKNGNEESSGEIVHSDNEDFSQEFGLAENDESSQEFIRNDNEDLSQEFGQTEDKEFRQGKTAELAHTVNEPLPLLRPDPEPAVNEESSSLAKANTEDTINRKIDSDAKVKNSNAVRFAASSGSVSSAPDHMPARESLTSPRSALKQPQNGTQRSYGRLRSVEFNTSSEFSGNLGETSKSPTRSSQAYDGSVSNYDVFDNQSPHNQSHLLEDDDGVASFLHSKEWTKREKFMAQAMMNRDSDVQQGRHSLSDKNNPALRNSKWDRSEFLEPARHERTARNWRPARHDHQSKSAFHDYENEGPSSRLQEKFQHHSSFQSTLPEDPEQMMKLLRMVLDIQNQSRKPGSLYDVGNERVSGLSQKPRYDRRFHNFEAPREAHFREPNDPRYLARYASGSNYTNRYRPKKIPFSGDPTSSSHQLDPFCSHCFPQKWSCSAQLPQTSHYNVTGQCRIHPDYGYCSCYGAFPPSPQWSVDSEYRSWGRDPQYDPPRRSQDLTNHLLRERHRSAKRHFRPVARGAPFILCYVCRNVLQLPADFLLFKKKCHRLRCGVCSHTLKFSLEKGSHIVRYIEKVVEPPSLRVVEDFHHIVNIRNEPSSTVQTPRRDPVSRSSDREADPAPATSIQTPLGKAFDRIIFGSAYATEDSSKEFAPEPSRGRYKERPPRHESSKPSSNKTELEDDEDTHRSTSPLHRLMGYSSPSQVIYGSRPYGLGTSGSYSVNKENY